MGSAGSIPNSTRLLAVAGSSARLRACMAAAARPASQAKSSSEDSKVMAQPAPFRVSYMKPPPRGLRRLRREP